MVTQESADVAVSIADLLSHDIDLINRFEGVLLLTGSQGEVRPVDISQKLEIDPEISTNIFRQLDSVDLVTRQAFQSTISETEFKVDAGKIRDLFTIVRDAVVLRESYQTRLPPSTRVTPLVTFPDDPNFSNVSPSDFDMDNLLSSLASEVKSAQKSIVLVAPFFEGAGFDRLQGVLASATERGVDITIVTRHLDDMKSHNRYVIERFLDGLRDEDGIPENIRTFDYTGWDEDVIQEERRQDGAPPAYTLHAKLMIFDNTSAYIGSANMTDYGFDRYLELGVLVRGTEVMAFRELYEYLLQSAGITEISLI